MPSTTRRIKYDDGDLSAQLTVNVATVRAGLRRQALRRAAGKANDDLVGEANFLRLFTWPDLVAVTGEGRFVREDKVSSIRDLTFEEWLDLPEALVAEWEQAVYELNPHWIEEYDRLGEMMRGSGTNSAAAWSDGTSGGGAPSTERT